MRIKIAIESLCEKYKTRAPFALASCKNILVLLEPLGSIRGYYNKLYRQKMIHINADLSVEEQRRVCAHELGHAILHPESNTQFLQTSTYFCVGKLEKEANFFAIDLLYPDEEMEEYLNFSIPELSACLNISEQLIRYRLSVIPQKRSGLYI